MLQLLIYQTSTCFKTTVLSYLFKSKRDFCIFSLQRKTGNLTIVRLTGLSDTT